MFKANENPELILKEINEENPDAELQIIKPISKSINCWHLRYNPLTTNNTDAINLFAVRKDVDIVQFNHNNVVRRDTCTNDPMFADQWAWEGSGGSVHISACDAWAITTGGVTAQGDRICVAVIDGGFDISHEDINFFENATEAAGTAGVDDDGNGYIDDINGWDAGSNDGTIPSASHGTHVAGTVGATGDNGIGVTGVNWDVDVMAIATNGGGGGGFESTVLTAYGYALEMRELYDQTGGAQGSFVVATNSSFGIDNADPADYPMWCAFYDSLGTRGIISAGATANNNVDVDNVGDVPTACPSDWLISVTNTDLNDNKAFAGYGLTTIDMGAPGSDILSTNPSDAYGNSSGTSMATPHVAGTIGLMWSAACDDMITDYKNDPGTLALTVRNYLLNDGLDYISSLSPTGSTPTVTGGRLNLHKAVVSMGQYGACPALGVKEESFGTLNVFPNPTAGNITMDYEGLQAGVYSVTLNNLLGQTVNAQRVQLFESGKTELDLTGVTAGQYILVFKHENGTFRSFQLVVE